MTSRGPSLCGAVRRAFIPTLLVAAACALANPPVAGAKPGDTVKLQLLGRDAPYYRASNGAFAIEATDVSVTLPTG